MREAYIIQGDHLKDAIKIEMEIISNEESRAKYGKEGKSRLVTITKKDNLKYISLINPTLIINEGDKQ